MECEVKKGKWSRRWLELREHGLFVAKREVTISPPLSVLALNLFQGKDDEFLCSLSNFDAYVVTRIQKAPKPFTFAVKSTDPMTLFEA